MELAVEVSVNYENHRSTALSFESVGSRLRAPLDGDVALDVRCHEGSYEYAWRVAGVQFVRDGTPLLLGQVPPRLYSEVAHAFEVLAGS